MFCPKCGSILIPKKEGDKKILACTCGYSTKDISIANITETIDNEQRVNVVDKEHEPYPIIKAKCEKCGNDKAYFWTVQTRAADEPETKVGEKVMDENTLKYLKEPVEIEDSDLYEKINKTGKLKLTYLFDDSKRVSYENYFFNGIKKPVTKIESSDGKVIAEIEGKWEFDPKKIKEYLIENGPIN